MAAAVLAERVVFLVDFFAATSVAESLTTAAFGLRGARGFLTFACDASPACFAASAEGESVLFAIDAGLGLDDCDTD